MDNGYENRRTEGSTRLRLTLCFTKVARKYDKNDGDDDLAHPGTKTKTPTLGAAWPG